MPFESDSLLSLSVADDQSPVWPGLPLAGPSSFPRVSEELLAQVRLLPGAATTCSDLLDGLGLALAIPSDMLPARVTRGVVAGHVITAAYVPERRAISYPGLTKISAGLKHEQLWGMASPGDVVVIDARGVPAISLLGGLAAGTAHGHGISGCIVDGGVRDLDEIRESGLSVWSRSLTPRTGRWRVEPFAFNLPVVCGGVQVHPGDVVVADETGICFFPHSLAEQSLRQLLQISNEERALRKA